MNDGKRRLHLKQQRYLADGTTDDQIWQIPLTFVKASKLSEPFYEMLLTKREEIIELDGIGENEWIKVGFNRVSSFLGLNGKTISSFFLSIILNKNDQIQRF